MPAAAVTPAPIAYIKVVAVKKLVVGYLVRKPTPPPSLWVCVCWFAFVPSVRNRLSDPFMGFGIVIRTFYFEKIKVFKAGVLLEYISME